MGRCGRWGATFGRDPISPRSQSSSLEISGSFAPPQQAQSGEDGVRKPGGSAGLALAPAQGVLAQVRCLFRVPRFPSKNPLTLRPLPHGVHVCPAHTHTYAQLRGVWNQMRQGILCVPVAPMLRQAPVPC